MKGKLARPPWPGVVNTSVFCCTRARVAYEAAPDAKAIHPPENETNDVFGSPASCHTTALAFKPGDPTRELT